MSVDDQDLIRGERVVYTTHLHWIVLVAPFTFASVLLLAGVLFIARPEFLRDRLDDLTAAAAMLFPTAIHESVVLGFALVLVGMVVAVAGLWQRASTELTVTTRRVTVRTGLALRRTLEILLPQVESVEIDQTLWGGAMGFGTVVVRGTGGTPEPIAMVADPFRFRREVQGQIELAHPPSAHVSTEPWDTADSRARVPW